MRRLAVDKFSDTFEVRIMDKEDAPVIYEMTKRNVQYYEFCGRNNVMEDIFNDLISCPPGKALSDKYYVGFFEKETLIAVLDLIDGFPDAKTAYIGFFMMNRDYQGKGIGSEIVAKFCQYLKEIGFEAVRLGYEKSNPQSSYFWKKNCFEAEKEVDRDGGIIVVAQRQLFE